jgi:hypothetical protein
MEHGNPFQKHKPEGSTMLKTGTQTGSLQNHLYSRMTKGQPEPVVGMGATILSYTDRHAATISKVFQDGKKLCIAVQRDDVRRVDSNGLSEDQKYIYSPRPDAAEHFFRFDGKSWHQIRKNSLTGRWNKTDGYGIRIGERQEYYDPSF